MFFAFSQLSRELYTQRLMHKSVKNSIIHSLLADGIKRPHPKVIKDEQVAMLDDTMQIGFSLEYLLRLWTKSNRKMMDLLHDIERM